MRAKVEAIQVTVTIPNEQVQLFRIEALDILNCSPDPIPGDFHTKFEFICMTEEEAEEIENFAEMFND